MSKQWQLYKEKPELQRALQVREWVIDAIRIFFKQSGFHELETPLLVHSPDPEPSIAVFQTELQMFDGTKRAGYLTTSPEFSLKKMLAAGVGSCFQVCKAFRNGEVGSTRHNPEFTILEWYRVNADYTAVMKDCENLLLFILRYVADRQSDGQPIALGEPLSSATELRYQGKSFDLSTGWEVLTVSEAFHRYANIDQATLLSTEGMLQAARDKGYQVTEQTTYQEVFDQIFMNEVEHFLGATKPTIICEYLASQAALARKKPTDPRFAERFEFYINGLELGNAFSELTEWQEQEERLQEDVDQRAKLGLPTFDIDHDFVDAVKAGFPPTGGIAVGVDRLVMLFSDSESIVDTLALPAKDLFELDN